MRNNVDEMVKQWGRRRKSELGESHTEAVEGAMRAIEDRRFTSAQPPAFSSWWVRLVPAAAAVVCLSLFATFFQAPPGQPGVMICEVPCKAELPVDVPQEPLVPVDRYQSLFQENL